MTHPVDRILGPGGLLDEHLTGYEPRPQQLQMAMAVHRAFETNKRAVIEAATGTGKTLAYMIPALLSRKRVVISTATKALQSQIVDKDVPLLSKVFAEARPPIRFSAVNLKGRSNYLCLFRFENLKETMTFTRASDAVHFQKIVRWAKRTRSGDRSTIKGLPDQYSPWSQLSATGHQCHGKRCEHYEDCFITKRRREAREADLIIVNHHLFFADLALRRAGIAELLPEYDAVVFDEAHHLEQTATSFFGDQLSTYRLTEMVSDTRRTLEAEDALTRVGEKILRGVETASEGFFGCFKDSLYEGRYAMEEVLTDKLRATLRQRSRILTDELERLATWLETADGGSATERLHERCRDLIGDTVTVTTPGQPDLCHIIERRGRGIFLEAQPIHIGGLFRKGVLEREGPQIYTSATLTTEGSFDFFCSRLGMNHRDDVMTARLSPVFDYSQNALLYIPRRLPAPDRDGWLEGVCTISEYLINMSEGRAFVLFTSYRNMEQVYEELAEKLDFPVLKQGDMPRGELLETFRADTHSVLFATSSFWEGVDVEGEALSLVIMDKLPFANPSDPLTQARMRQLEERGVHPFSTYQIPTAIIALKQGFGRLIRSHRDRGVVAILDSRLATRSYGRRFLESLPPARVVWNSIEAKRWWEGIAAKGD